MVVVALCAAISRLRRIVTRGAGSLLDRGKAAMEVCRIGLQGPVLCIVPIVLSGVGFQKALRGRARATVMAIAAVHQEKVGGMIIAGK